MAERDNNNITYEVVEKLCVLRTHPTGWTKEFNLVSWNGNEAKYDIRDWDPDHVRMSKGVTLQSDEMKKILAICEKRTF